MSAEPVRLGEGLVVARDAAGAAWIDCAGCGHRYGAAAEDPKLAAVVRELRIDELSPLNSVGLVDELVARQFCCPGCGIAFALNIQKHGDPVLVEMRLSL